MRTNVDLDEDILRTAKDLAEERSDSLGRVLSELARKGLRPRKATPVLRNGVPILPRGAGAKPVTSKIVKELWELED